MQRSRKVTSLVVEEKMTGEFVVGVVAMQTVEALEDQVNELCKRAD